MNIEIELKYQILDDAEISDFAKKLNFLSVNRVIDCYLDTIDADLFKKGIYIRVRDSKKVDIKFNSACLRDPGLGLQSYCEEYSFNLPFSKEAITKINKVHAVLGLNIINHYDLESYKKANNLIDHRIVDKIRSSYNLDQFTIVIDDVNELGKFLEIEVMASNIDNIVCIQEMLLAGLKLKPLLTGYDALILRKQNFKQYVQGRFVLKEDLGVSL
jgi:adenylate cyclase class IV